MRRKISFNDLEEDQFYSNLIRLVEAKHGQLTDDLKALLVDKAEWSGIVPKQHVEWILDLLRIVDSLNETEAAPSDYGLFWIRLHGLLREVYEYFDPDKSAISKDRLHIAAFEQLSKIKSSFSEEEILWIEHERNCHCHPAPTYYRKTGQMKETGRLTVKAHYNGRHLDDLNVALTAVIAPYRGDSRPLARELARRIAAELKSLSFYAHTWVEQT